MHVPLEPVSPRARRIRPPSWLDLRLIVGVALVLGSVLIGATVVSSSRHTYPAVAARHDLAVGTVLAAGDLRVERVRLPGHGSGVYLSGLQDAVGKQLSRAVSAGELVPAHALASTAAQTTVTVPLATGAAPDLHKGQRIELWVSTSSCASMVLLPDVTVQAVHTDASGVLGSTGNGQDVVISVAPELADRVMQALALDQVQLRAGVLAGAAGSGGGVATALPDLAACVRSGR